MNSLWLLFRMHSRGGLRRWWRSCKSIHGAIRAVFTILFCLLLSVPLLMVGLNDVGSAKEELISGTQYLFHNIFPLMIAFFFMVGIFSPKSSDSLNFTPAEIDQLFSAPFSRKQLLVYKLAGIVTLSLMLCFGLNFFFGAVYFFVEGSFLGAFFRGFLAISFAMLLIQFVKILTGQVRKSVIQRLITPLRKNHCNRDPRND